MNSFRKAVAAILRDNLPPRDYVVLSHGNDPDNLAKRAVQVVRTDIDPHDMHAFHTERLAVRVLVPEEYGEAAEDAADAAEKQVRELVDRIEYLTWEGSKRGVHANFLGWELTVSGVTPKE